MTNMSYCRFRNTKIDMDDCLAALIEAEDGEENISQEEIDACREIFDAIIDYLEDRCIINDNYFDQGAYLEWKDTLIRFKGEI